MQKTLAALTAALAVLGATQIASATTQTVTSKNFEFTVHIPAGPDHTLAEFKHCDPDLADNDPATPQDNQGCIRAKVKADTDATLTMLVSTPSSTISAVAATSLTDSGVCPAGQVGVRITLSGVVGGSKVKAIYDPSPGTPPNGDTTTLDLNGPGASRSPFATVCV